MTMELPITEIQTQQIALEECNDTSVPRQQINQLLDANITAIKGRANIGGAVVRFTHLLSPDADDPTPVVFGNGYCAPEGAYRPLAIQTALRGRNVSFLRPPRSQSLRALLDPRNRNNVLRLQEQAIWAASRDIMQQVDCNETDGYGHSNGGANITRAALHKAGRYRNIVLAASAGLDGKNTLTNRLLSIPQVAMFDIGTGLREVYDNSGPSLAIETAQHVALHPIRTIKEGVAVARVDIRGDIDRLRETGTKVGIILFDKDGFFDVDNVMAANTSRNFDDFKIIRNVRHIYVQQDPTEHSYDIDAMLADLTQISDLRAVS